VFTCYSTRSTGILLVEVVASATPSEDDERELPSKAPTLFASYNKARKKCVKAQISPLLGR